MSDSMGGAQTRWLSVPRLARLGPLLLLLGSWYMYVRGNDEEASAIARAGGDAGLWAVGIMFVTVTLAPSSLLLLLSVFSPSSRGSAVKAIIAGVLALMAMAWMTPSLYPPAKVSDEGFVLNTDQWQKAAHLYLAFIILLGAAGLLALLGGLATLRRSTSAGPSNSEPG